MKNEDKCCSSTKILCSILIVFILVGGVYLLMYSKLPWSGLDTGESLVVPATQENLHSSWAASVRSITSELSASSAPDEVVRIQDALLEFRVAGPDRDTHLNLVLALGRMAKGDGKAFAEIESILSSL